MKHNFGAGPCILPQKVFKQASEAVLDFNGLSILEVSHRHKDFVEVMDEATSLVKKALNVPSGYSVAFIQGGASLGFVVSALNMMRKNKKAGYIDTGTWASKAFKEANSVGINANILAHIIRYKYVIYYFNVYHNLTHVILKFIRHMKDNC